VKRGIVFIVAALVLLMSVPANAGAAASGSVAQIKASVSLRTGPSTSSNVLKYLKAGETAAVLEQTNAYWLKVKDGKGTIGYVSSSEKYVSVSTGSGAGQGTSGGNAVIVSSVSFRTGPSTGASRIRYLQKNEQVTVTSKPNDYWYAVTDASGTKGYISTSSQYVKLSGGVPQQPSQPSQPSGSAGKQVESVIAAGLKYLGTPYEYGSNRNTTTTFDCSDFVRQAFKDALNVVLPADSKGQGTYVKNKNTVHTDWRQLKRGDLMFFMDYKGMKASLYTGKKPFSEKISHVGIYLGDGKVLHTYSKDSGGVRTDSIAGKHWEYRFLYGGSAL